MGYREAPSCEHGVDIDPTCKFCELDIGVIVCSCLAIVVSVFLIVFGGCYCWKRCAASNDAEENGDTDAEAPTGDEGAIPLPMTTRTRNGELQMPCEPDAEPSLSGSVR